MKTNINFISRMVTACFFIMILASCESHEQKVDDAFERVKEEKKTIKDSTLISKALVEEPKKAEQIVNKIDTSDDWTKFKKEVEKKILANQNSIKALKSLPDANSRLLKKIAGLEKDNNDLRNQMDEYNEDMKVRLEKFKVQVNHDVNEIGIELKDITITNKK